MDHNKLLFYALIVFIVLALLWVSGCQNRDSNTYNITAYRGGEVRVYPSGENDQSRGNNAERALSEPNVSVIP